MDRLRALLLCSLVLTCTVPEGAAAAFNGNRGAAGTEKTAIATPIIKVADTRGPQGGTPKDQYKQMGSVAAIAEACYGSKAIPEKLGALMKKASAQNPSSVPAINLLIKDYNEAYFFASTEMKVWNGVNQSYSSTPFKCKVSDDVNLIKKLEATILDNLR